MKLYHYAKASDWEDIKEGSYISDHKPGLSANRRVGRKYNEASNTTAVFGLMDPLPKEWTENKDFHLTWPVLERTIGGRMLLEIDVDEKDENVFIIDRGHMEGFLYEDKENIPERFKFATQEEAEKAYIESKVPLAEYLKKKGELAYSLPEVIFLENIPLNKIKISEQQPILEKYLEKYKDAPAIMRSIMNDINSVPELSEWYKKRQELKNELNREFKMK